MFVKTNKTTITALQENSSPNKMQFTCMSVQTTAGGEDGWTHITENTWKKNMRRNKVILK